VRPTSSPERVRPRQPLAAHDAPDPLLGDLRQFFRTLR
jgi:hypothetical protein